MLLLAFEIFASVWVLAWVVLIVLGVVDLLFRLPPDASPDDERTSEAW